MDESDELFQSLLQRYKLLSVPTEKRRKNAANYYSIIMSVMRSSDVMM